VTAGYKILEYPMKISNQNSKTGLKKNGPSTSNPTECKYFEYDPSKDNERSDGQNSHNNEMEKKL
jgi:hypothetical protein